jgi:hypothetical protein
MNRLYLLSIIVLGAHFPVIEAFPRVEYTTKIMNSVGLGSTLSNDVKISNLRPGKGSIPVAEDTVFILFKIYRQDQTLAFEYNRTTSQSYKESDQNHEAENDDDDDGDVGDSDIESCFSFTIDEAPLQVIPGWNIAIKRMKVGDVSRIEIPYRLAFGDKGRNRLCLRSFQPSASLKPLHSMLSLN